MKKENKLSARFLKLRSWTSPEDMTFKVGSWSVDKRE